MYMYVCMYLKAIGKKTQFLNDQKIWGQFVRVVDIVIFENCLCTVTNIFVDVVNYKRWRDVTDAFS